MQRTDPIHIAVLALLQVLGLSSGPFPAFLETQGLAHCLTHVWFCEYNTKLAGRVAAAWAAYAAQHTRFRTFEWVAANVWEGAGL